ncbi:Flagellar protein FlgJ (peptidoglycan hydrolase) [Methylophaga frappieri]|uniref:Peptidoglycan hydrolase FlgJ n=1 Tax=Methylophaga frappieri (strain ATCC BAA-2434 / DSM 25690 / JAM7) TaxID=754477 RepID=I1YKM5_METFJ|nr:flagellar assembly peptidoglycan hydrolase FlgJ [Methylophaga frappieri]AFJ03468.1 Flagellar protein FlgJ (peptidoglycan hydrolase) [Methylophaga frappieri]
MTMATTRHTTLDFQGLNQLRAAANETAPADQTLRQVAAQFESLFVGIMLKSMRQAQLADGIFDSQHSNTYREMADQQLAMDLSASGGLGLQDMILRQLGGEMAGTGSALGGQTFSADSIQTRSVLPRLLDRVKELNAVATQPESDSTQSLNEEASRHPNDTLPTHFSTPAEFVRHLWPLAEQAAAEIGAAPEAIMAQAALETGWGKHILSDRQGSSFNLFNIKADSRWQGESTGKNVLEFINGRPVQQASAFRRYDNFADSFADYVDFLQQNPRYQSALNHADNPHQFVEKLHQAGYATDPQYASKLKRIMQGDTLAQSVEASDFMRVTQSIRNN